MKPPLRIMLVDDDQDDRDFFADAIHEIDPDIECILLNKGALAVQHLTDPDNPLPDYIFLDLRMPGISGKDLLTMIKKDDRLKEIPVFVYSTSNDELDADQVKKMGAIHFTTKPSDPREIYYVLSIILSEQW